MKKIIIPIILLIILLLSLRLYKLTNVNDYPVNIRTSPYPTGELFSQINKGDDVIVTKTYNKWIEILYENKILYTYREFLNCEGIKIYPLNFVIPCNLSYKWTPDILFTDSIKVINLKIPKFWIQIVLLVLIILVLLINPKKVKVYNNQREYPDLYKPEARSKVYRKNYNAVPMDFESKSTHTSTPEHTQSQNSNNDSTKEYPDSKSINKKKGDDFEIFIVKKISKKHYFFEDWASDKITDTGIWAASNQNPDLKFRHKKSKREFYLECKYRSSDNISISEAQLKRYKRFGAINSVNVFIIIGTEGTPDSPKNLYLIPSDVIKDSESINAIKEKYRKHNISNNLYFDPSKRTLA